MEYASTDWHLPSTQLAAAYEPPPFNIKIRVSSLGKGGGLLRGAAVCTVAAIIFSAPLSHGKSRGFRP